MVRRSNDIVQILNPKWEIYVKINRTTGEILSHKQSGKPYKNIPIVKSCEYCYHSVIDKVRGIVCQVPVPFWVEAVLNSLDYFREIDDTWNPVSPGCKCYKERV